MRVVFEANLEEEHLEQERSVILQEMHQKTEGKTRARFLRDFFPNRPGFHYRPAGVKKTVKAMLLPNLEELYQRCYFLSNSALIVVGACKNSDVINFLQTIDLTAEKHEAFPTVLVTDPEPKRVEYGPGVKEGSVSLIYPRSHDSGLEHQQIEFFNHLLDDSDVGLIYKELRHKRRQIYSCRAATEGSSTRWTEIVINCQPEIFEAAEEITLKAIETIRNGNVSVDDFNVVLAKTKTGYAAFHSPAKRYDISHWLDKLLGCWLENEYTAPVPLADVSKIEPSDMVRIANEYYRPEQAGRIHLLP